MIIVVWVTTFLVISMASVYLNSRFLTALEPSVSIRSRVKFWECLILSISAAVLVGAFRGALLPRGLEDIAVLLFCIWATVVAYFDRQTTWVTDQSLLAVMAVGMIIGGHSQFLLSVLNLQILNADNDLLICAFSIALAFTVLLITRQIHALQLSRGYIVVTGADVVAAGLPLLCFGVSLGTSISYGIAALILFALRVSDRFSHLIRRLDAVSEGLVDIGRSETRETDAVPAFMAFVPAVLFVLCVNNSLSRLMT